MKRIAILAITSFLLAGCGVKNDLVRPDGKVMPKTAPDPSKPPQPLGR